MIKVKLIKGRSYTGFITATQKHPIVEVKSKAEADAAIATGYFELYSEVAEVAQNDAVKSESVPDYESLSNMTKAELTAYAEENGISLDGCKTKADILEAISIANGGSATMMELQGE